MDVLGEGIPNFWRLMNTHRVSYIMAGGFAVNLHGYMPATADMDVWIEDTLEKMRTLAEAAGGAVTG